MCKTILITGGTGKIGHQLVEHFYKKGMCVVFTSRSNTKILSLINGCENIIGIQVDLKNDNAIQYIVETLKNKNIAINYIVNNAREIHLSPFDDDGSIKSDVFLAEYAINVVVPYKLSFELAKNTTLEKIINISSMYGMVSQNPHLYEDDFLPSPHYGCAKAAIIQLTKFLAVQFAEKNIQVNCISYGGVEGRVDEAFKEKYAKLCPQKRMMTEEECIGAVDFLVSSNSSYITGHNLVVDGGWSIW